MTVSFLNISGPNLLISGKDATFNRGRETGRNLNDSNACGQWTNPDACNVKPDCVWSPQHKWCSSKKWSYFQGEGVAVEKSVDIVLKNLQIAYCPASGVNVRGSDDISIEKSIVFGNTWWSTQGASAISISDAIGDKGIKVVGNVVYGNRNYIPTYQQSPV